MIRIEPTDQKRPHGEKNRKDRQFSIDEEQIDYKRRSLEIAL
jgi:hypothetical protein